MLNKTLFMLCKAASSFSSLSSTSVSSSLDSVARSKLPQAVKINGRFVSPWNENTNKGFTNVLNVIFFKEKVAKIESPKYTSNQDAIKQTRLLDDGGHKLHDIRRMTFSWIGHSTCYVQIGGCYILTDPVWCHRASPFESIGPARYFLPPVEIEELPFLDVILLSHTHYDHLDISSARRIGNKALWIVPIGVKQWLLSIGISNAVELNWWESHCFTSRLGSEISVTFTPTQHWTARTLFDQNTCLWGSFAVRSSEGSFFFGGDTAYNKIFQTIGSLLGPFDLAALPIGAYKPREYTKTVHCDPSEAVQIHRDLRAKQSVGIHWGGYPLTDEDVIEPPLELQRARTEAGVTSREFFTTHLGEIITAGDEPENDFAQQHPDLYELYLEQVWRTSKR